MGVLVPFVFEHLSNPFKGMQTLARAMKPGGFIVWAAPMFEQYHGAPHDYFRFTPKGAKVLAEQADLEVLRLYAPGDISLVLGVMRGMRLPYWFDEQVFSEVQTPGNDMSTHPLNVFMLLQKPRTSHVGLGGA